MLQNQHQIFLFKTWLPLHFNFQSVIHPGATRLNIPKKNPNSSSSPTHLCKSRLCNPETTILEIRQEDNRVQQATVSHLFFLQHFTNHQTTRSEPKTPQMCEFTARVNATQEYCTSKSGLMLCADTQHLRPCRFHDSTVSDSGPTNNIEHMCTNNVSHQMLLSSPIHLVAPLHGHDHFI